MDTGVGEEPKSSILHLLNREKMENVLIVYGGRWLDWLIGRKQLVALYRLGGVGLSHWMGAVLSGSWQRKKVWSVGRKEMWIILWLQYHERSYCCFSVRIEMLYNGSLQRRGKRLQVTR